MCGITGIIGLEDFANWGAAADTVVKMNRAMAHRGPDATGVWSDEEEVVLGHQRLSIIDTSDAANQPWIHPPSGDAFVFNGEVYNYRELRAELKDDFVFRSDSDTEVVLAALQAWGVERALQRFNGMFAFAWWQASTRTLVIARDRMGIKPVYFAEVGRALLFASEIRSLLASGRVSRRHDPEGLVDYLRYQTVHAPRTILAEVQMLPPGHYIRIQGAEQDVVRWWDVAKKVDFHPRSANREELLGRVRDTLRDAVSLRMRADVPLGAFLSGGIDSSAIVGLMKEVAETRVATFSVTFNEGEYDESPWSRMIAQRFDTDHHEIRLTPEDFLKQVPAALEAMDHPSGDGPNTFVVSQATKAAGITVALSGLGGDELFAGYPVFQRSRELLDKRWLTSWPKGLRKLAGRAYVAARPGMTSRKMADLLAGEYFDLEHTYPLSRQMFLERDVRRLAPDLASTPNAVNAWLRDAIAPNSDGYNLPFLSKVSLAEMHTYMGHTLLRDTDQMSMAHALEVRVPFLDHRLVTEALRASDNDKWPHTPKQLLTDAIGDLLPDEVMNRPKMGFVLPWEHWMRGELRELCERGLKSLERLAPLRAGEIQKIWLAFLKGDPAWTFARLWMLVVLGDWVERNGIE